MKHNSDMINMVKLVEGKDQFAGEEVGQKPGDQVRGTDVAKTKGTDHPFKGRLVGEDTTLEDVLSKKYQDFKDIQAKEKEEKSHPDYSKHEKKLISKMSNAEKVDRGWRKPDIDEQGMLEGNGSTLDHILAKHADAVDSFKQGGDLDYDLESDLWDYYFTRGDIKNYDADASEYIAQQLADYLGIDEQTLDEISLGDYMKKATMSRAQSQMSAAFAKDPAERERHAKKALKRWSGIDRARTRLDKQRQAAVAKERSVQTQRLLDKYAGVDIDAEIDRLQPALQSAYRDYQYGARNTWRQGKEEYDRISAELAELKRVKELMSQSGVNEEANPTDKVIMDVPLMLRMFEYAREDAQTDMDLHDVAERLIKLSSEGRVLTMQDYDTIVGQQQEQMVSELGAEGSALGSVAAAKSAQAALSTKPSPVNPDGKEDPATASTGIQPPKPTIPTTTSKPGQTELTPDEQDALDKIKANAGLKSQYDRLLKQAGGGV